MKETSRYIMALLYILAGANHFAHPLFYLKIMPAWIPHQMLVVYVSGICEIFFAVLLLYSVTKKVGAWLIILLLVAVFPANIQMAINYMHENNPHLWVAIVRLPLQLVLIWWAWIYTKPPRKINPVSS